MCLAREWIQTPDLPTCGIDTTPTQLSWLLHTSALIWDMVLLCWRLYLIDNSRTCAYKIIIIYWLHLTNWILRRLQIERENTLKIHVSNQSVVPGPYNRLCYFILCFDFHCFRLPCGVCINPDQLFISHMSDDFLCDIIQSYEVPKWKQT
jgi:hypothetical protein